MKGPKTSQKVVFVKLPEIAPSIAATSLKRATARKMADVRRKARKAKQQAKVEKKRKASSLAASAKASAPGSLEVRQPGQPQQFASPAKASPPEHSIPGSGLANICPHCSEIISKRRTEHVKKCLKKQQAFQSTLEKCGICQQSFLRSKLPAHVKRDHSHIPSNVTRDNIPIREIRQNIFLKSKLAMHTKERHSCIASVNIPIRFAPPEPPVVQPLREARIPCRKCKEMIFPYAMDKHFVSCHPPESEVERFDLERFLKEAKKFPFVLLRPSEGTLRASIEKYRRLLRANRHSFVDESYDYKRLNQVQSLGSIEHHMGVKSWRGYVAFEFPHSSKVVLECPLTGNATYVLSGEWRKMISCTKAELRSEYGRRIRRIFHTPGWEEQVRRAIFGSGSAGPQSSAVCISPRDLRSHQR